MVYKEIRKLIKIPDVYSIVGLIFSLSSIYFSLNKEFFIALVLILAAGFCDNLDGRIARRMKRQGEFGKELDNLCDVVTFLVAIVVFGYMAGIQSYFALIVYVLFVLSGVLRLARFGVTGTVEGFYHGVPVGYNVGIPIMYFILSYFNVDINYLLALYIIQALLMVSDVKIKKF